MEGLVEGRIVHYVMPDGRHPGEHRPAIIVKVWGQDNGCSNLLVFTDFTNDYEKATDPVVWKTSIVYDADAKPATWHWIERA